jgi:hypothetical protein
MKKLTRILKIIAWIVTVSQIFSILKTLWLLLFIDESNYSHEEKFILEDSSLILFAILIQILIVGFWWGLYWISSNFQKIKKSLNSNPIAIPLWAGWLVNIIGWVLFISTFNHVLEILTGILCIGCVFIGYKHKQNNTPAFLGLFSAGNLIWASAFEAIWMFAWGLGFF